MIILKLLILLAIMIIDLIIFNISASTLVARDQALEDCMIILKKFKQDVWTFTSILNEICVKSSMSNDILTAFMDHDFTPERSSQMLDQLKTEQQLDSHQVVKIINKYGIKPTSINNVITDSHSNNRSEVVKSCTDSALKLARRYPNVSTKDNIEKIQYYIRSHSVHNETIKANALSFIKQLQKNETVHSQTNQNLTQTLALVYQATLDKSASVNPDNTTLNGDDIQERIESLIKNLHMVYIERCVNALDNTLQPTCFMGMHNDIIATLDMCHTDVRVNSLSADTLIAPKVLEYVTNALDQNPNKQHIIDHWMHIEDDVRDQWLKRIQPQCQKELLMNFKDIFKEDKISEFTSLDALDSLPLQDSYQSHRPSL